MLSWKQVAAGGVLVAGAVLLFVFGQNGTAQAGASSLIGGAVALLVGVLAKRAPK
jgi:drug/metabolite transporter (DMT)-like permease